MPQPLTLSLQTYTLTLPCGTLITSVSSIQSFMDEMEGKGEEVVVEVGAGGEDGGVFTVVV